MSKKKKNIEIVLAVLAVIVFIFLNYFDFNKMEFKKINFKNIFSIESIDIPDGYDMSVHVLDVSDADSIYIKSEDKNILIDSGDKDLNNYVSKYLKRQNIDKIDLVIVTHPHGDHIGGMSSIINNFEIKNFIMPNLKDGVLTTTKVYEDMLMDMLKKGITPKEPKPGTSFEIGKMKIDILAPNNFYDDVNNYSVVTKISYGKISFLFTGDAEKESEKDILKAGYDVGADVLKVGHHGSKTSTTKEFLKAVHPKYAVISSSPGKHNHPHKSTLNKLYKNKVQILRTDQNGTIVFATNGEDIKIIKEKE